MEVIRKVVDSETIGSVIALPRAFRHKKVEVIVLPFHEKAQVPALRKSYFGLLSKYANPSLIEQEKDAWAEASVEKHAHR